jgi:hypothetical protein
MKLKLFTCLSESLSTKKKKKREKEANEDETTNAIYI